MSRLGVEEGGDWLRIHGTPVVVTVAGLHRVVEGVAKLLPANRFPVLALVNKAVHLADTATLHRRRGNRRTERERGDMTHTTINRVSRNWTLNSRIAHVHSLHASDSYVADCVHGRKTGGGEKLSHPSICVSSDRMHARRFCPSNKSPSTWRLYANKSTRNLDVWLITKLCSGGSVGRGT